MLRLFAPLVFIVLFVAWVFYRLIIKKDLKRNLNTFCFGLFFMGLWTVIYFFMFIG